MKPISTLPKILALLDVNDHGPCDDGPSAYCPHCGAGGRYVYRFLCEDGKIHGAMAGCLKLFPQHQFTQKVKAVLAKEANYAKKKFNLPSWDQDIVTACANLAAQQIAFSEWENRVRSAFTRRDTYLNQKFGPRRYGRR